MTKRAHTQALNALKRSIGTILDECSAITRNAQENVSRRMTAAVIDAHRAEDHVASVGVTWMQWAKETFPGTPDPTLYRYRNAGTVAALIADAGGDVSEVGYTLFVPPYRLLKAAKSDEEREAARVEILARWAKLTQGGNVPQLSDVEEAFADSAPTRGKGAGDAKATTENRKAAKSRRKGKVAEKPTETPTEADAETRENAKAELARIMGRYSAEDLPGVKSAILAGVKLAEVFGPGVAFSVVKGYRVK